MGCGSAPPYTTCVAAHCDDVHRRRIDVSGTRFLRKKGFDTKLVNDEFTYRKDKDITTISMQPSNYCLDAPERRNGGKLHMIKCDPNNGNQHFVRDGKLIRYAYDRNFCIDANNGRRAHMWRCDSNNNNQKWNYNSSTKLLKAAQGKCLDNPGSERKNGGYIHMWNAAQATATSGGT